jgi:hypothetical protein
MSKGKDHKKKETRKAPLKTADEKRKAKKQKKTSSPF